MKASCRLGVLTALALLGACSSQSYKCPVPTNLGGCRSLDRVYSDTRDLDDTDTPSAGVPAAAAGDVKYQKAESVTRIVVAAGNARPPIAPAGPGAALLTTPRVLRVLITPWPDADGDLQAGGYVYLRLDRGQWTIPH